MSNLTVDEQVIITDAMSSLNREIGLANEANQDLQSVMLLDERDDENISTKAAARSAGIRLRATLVAAIAVIDGIEFPV